MFEVQVTPEQSTVLQKIAFKNGFSWLSDRQNISYINQPYLAFVNGDYTEEYGRGLYKNNILYGIERATWVGPCITFEQAVDYFINGTPFEKSITLAIDKYKVEIRPDKTIKFGCTEISTQDVQKIIDALNSFKS
jgi:hypothetical protein